MASWGYPDYKFRCYKHPGEFHILIRSSFDIIPMLKSARINLTLCKREKTINRRMNQSRSNRCEGFSCSIWNCDVCNILWRALEVKKKFFVGLSYNEYRHRFTQSTSSRGGEWKKKSAWKWNYAVNSVIQKWEQCRS